MLYIIGLGLGNERDITVRGLEAVKKCGFVYLEDYTSKLQCSVEDLEKLYGRKIIVANRDLVEDGEEIIENAKKANVALLVIGDALSATTHFSLVREAKEHGVEVKIIHNASIITAVASTGLQLYKFGKTASIPYWEKSYEPEVFYDVLKVNKNSDMHTLLLLDIKSDRMMSCDDACELLLKIEKKRKENVVDAGTLCICCAALGSDKEQIKVQKLGEKANLTSFPQCLIIPTCLNHSEEEFLEIFKSK